MIEAAHKIGNDLDGAFWEGGARTFIHKGTNGRWTDSLPADVSSEYENRAVVELGLDAASWLIDGSGR